MQIGKIKNNNIDIIFSIIEEDQKELLKIVNLINIFDDIIVTPAVILYQNIQDLKIHKQSLIQNIKLKGPDFLFDVSIHKSHLIRSIMNILTSFRSFLDIIAHRMKECYTNHEEIAKYYKDWQSEMFDSYFCYRFLYRFRNYVQHYGVPLDDLNLIFEKLTEGKVEVSILVLKEKLIEYKDWGSIKKEILDLPEKLEIEPLIYELYGCVDYIQRNLINYFLFEKGREIDYLIKLFQEIKAKGNEEQMVIIEPYPEKNESKIHFVNVYIIDALIGYIEKNKQNRQVFLGHQNCA